ncbi:MAG: hypothetical protein AB1638_04630 [Nitrospirota bacterium]
MRQLFSIGIGGAHSGVGKTTIAVALLKYLTRLAENPFTDSPTPKWGAIKFTKTDLYSSISDDKEILNQENKDTRRLLNAGAEEVLWVQSPENQVDEVMSMAIFRLSHLDGIIIEGNSAIEFARPDIVIFLHDPSQDNIKSSAQRVLKQADIIIVPDKRISGNLSETDDKKTIFEVKRSKKGMDERTTIKLIDCMEKIIKGKKV